MKTKVKITKISKPDGIVECVKSKPLGWDNEIFEFANNSIIDIVAVGDTFFVNESWLSPKNKEKYEIC